MSNSSDKSLCLYNRGTLALTRTLRQETDTWKLEDTIDSHLQDTKDDESLAVQMGIRYDAHWLKCRSAAVTPQTVLGIFEEEEGQVENPPVILEIYDSLKNENGSSTEHLSTATTTQACSCVAPHSEWMRTQNEELPTVPNGRYGDEAKPVRIQWIDIRQWQHHHGDSNGDLLQTPASVCHFLRSLLGISHSSSPWVATAEEKEEPHVVALVMKANPPETLTEFCVGDVSPSFFIHSVTKLYLPIDANWIASVPPSEAFTFGDLREATLLVFRRLAPRDFLSVQHPLGEFYSGQNNVPDACLWETYVENNNEEEEEPELKYRLLGPPYVSHRQDYPNLLEPLLTRENFQAIRSEAQSIPQWTAWPEKQHYSSSEDGSASWTVFPLCHCFPANLVENRQWINSTCAFVPQTTALLQKHLGNTLRTALFSRLDAQSTLAPHTGWEDLANHVYRIHLPLVVPPGGLCGTWVDGCVETHQEGRLLCFDDSKVHRAFNYSLQERLVLILDLARPADLPDGTATGGHTDELDKFIQQLT